MDCPKYDIKSSDGEIPVLELWRIRCTLSLLPSPLWQRVVVPVKVQSMGQIEFFNHLLRIIIISYLKPSSYMQIVHIRQEYLSNRITNVK